MAGPMIPFGFNPQNFYTFVYAMRSCHVGIQLVQIFNEGILFGFIPVLSFGDVSQRVLGDGIVGK